MIVLYLPKYGVPLDDPCCYPLGFMYVSSLLKAWGNEVKVLNCNLFDYDLSEEINGVTDIFFTGFEEFAGTIKEAAAVARAMGVKTHLGGAIATYAPKEMEGHIDYFYRGEFCPDLPIDKNPWPDYEGFGISEYHRRHSTRYMGVLTSRGCPHSCTFCNSICKYRCRSMESVELEIDHYINHYKSELIVVNDNTLNASKGRFRRFCEMMKGKGVAWSAALRLDNIDESLICLAKDSGMVSAVVGVESFQQEKLDAFNKNIKVSQITKGLDLFERHKIKYLGNVLVSSDADFNEAIPYLSKYTIYPTAVKKYLGNSVGGAGSEITERCRKYVLEKGLYYNA